MGWWGVNIMEGDPPLDAAHKIHSWLDYDDLKEGSEFPKEKAEKRQALLVDKINKVTSREGWDKAVHFQVLGEILMRNDVKIASYTRRAIEWGILNDAWANEGGSQSSKDRKIALNRFLLRLDAHCDS
jgi:hypothetical protein